MAVCACAGGVFDHLLVKELKLFPGEHDCVGVGCLLLRLVSRKPGCHLPLDAEPHLLSVPCVSWRNNAVSDYLLVCILPASSVAFNLDPVLDLVIRFKVPSFESTSDDYPSVTAAVGYSLPADLFASLTLL